MPAVSPNTPPPVPVQGPSPTPVPVQSPAAAPVPLQAPPAPIPVPPPSAVPTPVHPAASAPASRPQVVSTPPTPTTPIPVTQSVPPPGLVPAYPPPSPSDLPRRASGEPRYASSESYSAPASRTYPGGDPAGSASRAYPVSSDTTGRLPRADDTATLPPTIATSPPPPSVAPGQVPAALTRPSGPLPSIPGPSPAPPISAPPAQPFRGNGIGNLDRYTASQSDYANGSPARPAPTVPPPGSRATWPLVGESAPAPAEPPRPATYGVPTEDPRGADVPRQREGRVVPPWQSDDLPEEPPSLRLVEPAPLADPALTTERPPAPAQPEYQRPPAPAAEYNGQLRFEPPALRLVESPTGERARPQDMAPDRLTRANDPARGEQPAARPARQGELSGDRMARAADLNGDRPGGPGDVAVERMPRRAARREETPVSSPPVGDEVDGDLLIFAEARSAWFTDHFGEEDAKMEWANPSDAGWRAAEQAAEPNTGTETGSGLPRRVPQQNLVPGSPVAAAERPLQIVRDAAAIAAHTTGYFRGWRRGQEVGGYKVGGRPGREAAGGWDFSREQGEDERDYEYRQARR